jgi:hypothetical protein
VTDRPRYRIENDSPVIDVRIASVERMFDNRDPAPFRDRDLDPGLVEYLFASSEDLLSRPAFRIVFWLETPGPASTIEEAFRAYYAYELDRLDRKRRRQRRLGQVMLVFAMFAIAALLSLAQLAGTALHNSFGAAIKEGLVISAWVLMWKPVEVLVYDGIPYRRERKTLRRLLDAPIEVRTAPRDAEPPR